MLTAVKIATNGIKDITYTPARKDVERIFGFDGKHENVPFIKSLDKYKVPIQESSQAKQTEVMKLTSTQIEEGERAALDQNQKLVAKAQAEKVCESTDKKTTEDICNKITDATECNNKP
ncbi:uncharacterized protein TEOVI_000806100 [Trypanosoma equiperdum]|uniref:Uncharacterized protein n=1 Tax=Trypanosoma equiperdum TaxID=5694 RepID=A0A1G4I2I8_TRYEQ|nr:hypothetical protein, conserved [Trypanosoma equiperdum]